MGKIKVEKWINKIGDIELDISHTSGIYDLAFLMGFDWYGQIEEIVEGIRRESLEGVYKEFCEWEMSKDLSKEQKEMFDDLLSELSKLKDNK